MSTPCWGEPMHRLGVESLDRQLGSDGRPSNALIPA